MAENSDFSTHTPRPAPQGSPTRGIVLKLVSNCAANSMAESTTHVILYQEPWSAAAPGATSKATDFPTLPIKCLSPALSCGIVVSWDGWWLFVAFNYGVKGHYTHCYLPKLPSEEYNILSRAINQRKRDNNRVPRQCIRIRTALSSLSLRAQSSFCSRWDLGYLPPFSLNNVS